MASEEKWTRCKRLKELQARLQLIVLSKLLEKVHNRLQAFLDENNAMCSVRLPEIPQHGDRGGKVA